MFGEAEQVDREQDASCGDARGDELPEVLRGRDARRRRLDAALATLDRERCEREERAETARRAAAGVAAAAAARGETLTGRPRKGTEVERAEAALARARDKAGRHRAQVEAVAAERGRKPNGPAPRRGPGISVAEAHLRDAQDKARAAAPADQDTNDEHRANITDPDSRLMKAPGGWVQGYNAQAAVNTNGVILAAEVTQQRNDAGQCAPMIAATRASLDRAGQNELVGVMLFDAGYLSEANITTDGPDRLIATGKAWKLKRTAPTSGLPPDDASPLDAMEHRLRTPEGAATYALRQHTVEPVFGTIKEERGYRRFTRRGLAAVQAEWKLITAAHNLRKLFDHHQPHPA
jgi:Transposase DDE domain